MASQRHLYLELELTPADVAEIFSNCLPCKKFVFKNKGARIFYAYLSRKKRRQRRQRRQNTKAFLFIAIHVGRAIKFD